MEVGLSLGDFVRWGSSHVPQKGQTPTQFSAHVYCGQTAALTKMPLGTEVDLGLRDIVCDVDPGIPEKNGAPPILAHVYCGQMAGWMKLVLSIEVGRSPGNFVLDGNPAPSPKRGRRPHPQFSAHFYCGQTAGCIKMPLGTDVGLCPGDFVLDGDPLPIPKRGVALNFRPIFIVAKRLDASRCHLVWR